MTGLSDLLEAICEKLGVSKSFVAELWMARVGALLDLFAGAVFSWAAIALKLLPWEIALYPVLMGVRGAVAGVLVGRLSTALHLGTIEPRLTADNYDLLLLIGSQAVLASLSCFVMFAYTIVTMPILGIPPLGTLYVSAFVMLLSIATMAPITVKLSEVAVRRGWNTDVILYPVVAAIADVIVTVMYSLAVILNRSVVFALQAFVLVTVGVLIMVFVTFGRDREFTSCVRQSLTAVIIALCFETLAGRVLTYAEPVITHHPGILVVYPPLMTSLGGYGSALGSIASTRFHFEWSSVTGFRELLEEGSREIIATYLSAVLFFLLVITLGGGPLDPALYLVALGGGILALLIVLPCSYALAFFTFKKGLDPDNYVNPLISSLSDLTMTACLVLIGLAIDHP